MDHYIDLRVRPDPEFPAPMLLNALSAKLHRALVTLQAEDIGISFPRHRTKGAGLGDTLRLHGKALRLTQLMETHWLNAMADHVDATTMQRIPEGAQYRVVRRVQTHSNVDRIRRRQIKRHGWTEQFAREQISSDVEQRLDLPYLQLRSQSTGQNFRLFVEHQPCQANPVSGKFNAYSLSNTATIPWF